MQEMKSLAGPGRQSFRACSKNGRAGGGAARTGRAARLVSDGYRVCPPCARRKGCGCWGLAQHAAPQGCGGALAHGALQLEGHELVHLGSKLQRQLVEHLGRGRAGRGREVGGGGSMGGVGGCAACEPAMGPFPAASAAAAPAAPPAAGTPADAAWQRQAGARTSRQKPEMIMPTASSTSMPRCRGAET